MSTKPKINKKELLIDFLIPGIILTVFTIIFRTTNLDLWIQNQFYIEKAHTFNRYAMPWYYFYKFGPMPAVIYFIVLCVIFVFGFFLVKIVLDFDIPKYKKFVYNFNIRKYRKATFYAVLVMILGPGLLVNSIFKNSWGRPRPEECKIYNGEFAYVKVWSHSKDNPSNGSFPAGHPSVGFFLVFLYFLYRKRNKKAAYAGLALSLIYGIILGLTRMIQGGHFASDVLWCWGFVYLSALILYYCFRYDIPPETDNKITE